MKANTYDAVIIGGGAAGLFCASQLAQRKNTVLVLERTSKVGKKILMSGGGRCNFTNMYVEPENFLSENPHYCKSALNGYTQWDFIELVERYNIPYHEKKLGQLFCDNSSKDILDMLLAECDAHGVEINTRCEISAIEKPNHYEIQSNLGVFKTPALIIACGGLSIPSMGVTSFGYEVAQQFGMQVLPTRAGLVPFTFSDNIKSLSNKLSGLSIDVELSNKRQSFRENILFTHRGLSGPAVLQLSSYWEVSESISLNLLPDTSIIDWLIECKTKQPKTQLKNVISERLPKNLVAELENLWWPTDTQTPLAEFSHQKLNSIANNLGQWQLKPSGTEGYRTAEVTLGGVDTNGLSSKTMESKQENGLFFIGEVVDVTGHLGGFNFQWAWASGYAAAQAL
ncbi:MAG: NAD(P)/FAD-dependent oxidoreductase [Gammaproteobacteria bacterium]|nr:NAD(P)/FAD-dependent oxidoreductase [Gammaproteobacteria bacterium]